MDSNRPHIKKQMFAGANPLVFERAEELRKSMTHAEELLWYHLKQKPGGFKFRRQHPYGPYIFDFYCHSAKLVIELDGSIHELEEVKVNDEIRQRTIEEAGLKILRFTNKDVLQNVSGVVEEIMAFVKSK